MLDDVSLKDALKVLHNGGTILYPTDTIWGIGCDATNAKAVEKIYRIKERLQEKSLIILVKDIEMLKLYVDHIPEVAIELMEGFSDPITVIYPKGRNLANNVLAGDGSIAIRIPHHDLCQQLLAAFGRPITSTSANLSGGGVPFSFRSIDDQIKHAVDFVLPCEQDMMSRPKPSTIINIDKQGEIHILRS